MTAGTRPERRVSRAAPFPARSRFSALMVTTSAMTFSSNGGSPAHPLRGAVPPCSAARPPGVPYAAGNLVEQAGDRLLLADPADRLGDQRGDRDLADVARQPHRLGRLDAVGRH